MKNQDKEEKKNQDSRDERIEEMSAVEVKSGRGKISCISIIGEIEGHTVLPPQSKTTKYEHMLPELVRIEEDDDIGGLLLMLNTVGGDVEAGLAIAEMVAGMKKPTVSMVLGGGHSIGVPLAVAAKKSFIVPSATMTVHPIRMTGTVIGAPQTFRQMHKVQDRLVEFVVRNSGIEEEKFTALMMETENIANDVGTVLYGEEAVACGLIDGVGGIADAMETLHHLMKE